MDLFSQIIDTPENILPKDGLVYYYGTVFAASDADLYMQKLLETIEWKHDTAIIMGKHITTKRKVAWYASQAFEYSYSNTTKRARPWTKELIKLKAIVEEKTGETYNSCLLNLYHNGDEGMAWHSDAEKDLKRNGAIASLSFGAARKFSFKHKKTKEKVSVVLNHGDLLVMTGSTQSFWMHRLPPSKKVIHPRVNLTFRTIVE